MADSSKPAGHDASTAMHEPTSHPEGPPWFSSLPQNAAVMAQDLLTPMDGRASGGYYPVPTAHGNPDAPLEPGDFGFVEPGNDSIWNSSLEASIPRGGVIKGRAAPPAPGSPVSVANIWPSLEPDDPCSIQPGTDTLDWDAPIEAGLLKPPAESSFPASTFSKPAKHNHLGSVKPGRERREWRPDARSDYENDDPMGVGLAEGVRDVDNEDKPQQLLFACPFFKLDPFQYRDCLFRHTASKTNYVKQHIRRYHLQPIHCPSCGEQFRDEQGRRAHIRLRACDRQEFHYDGATEWQIDQLRGISNKARSNPTGTWYRIWDIMFPGKLRPASPYVKDPWHEVLEIQQQMWMKNRSEPFSTTPGSNLAMPGMQKAVVVENSPQENPAPQMYGRPISCQTDSPDAEGPPIPRLEASTFTAIRLQEDVLSTTVANRIERGGEGTGAVAAEGAPNGASGESWNENDGITGPPSPGSNAHASEEPAVRGLTTPSAPEQYDSVGGNDHPQEVYGSSLPGVDAIPSEEGGTSGKDSGYASLEKENKAAEADDDAGSNYSAESISPVLKDGYITTFSSRLAQDIDRLSSFSRIPDERLGELVRLFSLKLHGESSTRIQREASVFIRKKRSNIIGELAGRSLPEPSALDSDGQSDESPRPQFCKPQYFVEDWLRGLEPPGDPGQETLGRLQIPEDTGEKALGRLQIPEDAGEETLSTIAVDEEPIHLPNLTEYEQFISESRAYQWLLSIIESHSELEARGEHRMASIGDDIRSQLLSHPTLRKVSRSAPPATVRALFTLDWDPRRFFTEQEYGLPPGEVFDHVVCLTGTFQQAQATTMTAYLEQTWPLTHQPLQELLRKALSPPILLEYEHTLRDGSTLTFRRHFSSCIVRATGRVDFISEIGEQLAWIAATLRSSPVSDGVLACVPKLSFPLPPYVGWRDAILTLDCQMDFEMIADQDISRHSPGFCWAGLFRNPLLVTNYPIRRRAEVDTGLEMSLPMMAELVHSRQLLSLGGRMVLKGFCSLLMATAVANDVVMWHLFYNPTGERISYYDPRLEGIKCEMPQGFSLKDLEARRHIVGWCSSVVEYSGLPNANLAIRETNLPTPSKSIVIEKLYIEGGGPVVGGVMIALGKRAKPVYLKRGDSLSDSFDWVADQPVVFYDVDNQRAWLVDGASALLHLVRASIERDRVRPAYRDKWKFNGLLRGSSAMEILGDPDNLNTTLYVDFKMRSPSGTEVDVVHSFRDRVQNVLRYLEALIESQVQAATQDGYWIRTSDATPTKTAVGFDFWDVARPPKCVHGRVHSLRTPGHGWVHGWVDYIRSIGAMIIFGNDFGELIRPRSADGLCPGWNRVPTGAELMCCTIETLKALQTKARKGGHLGPGELASGIVWSSRRQLFAPCPCLAPQTSAAASPHVDPVQFLLPKNKLGQLDVTQACVRIALGDLGDLGSDGAVVFGHTPYYKTRPRFGYSRSSQEQTPSRNGSISGTSRSTTQEASDTGLLADDDRILVSRPGNPLKRLWDAFLRT